MLGQSRRSLSILLAVVLLHLASVPVSVSGQDEFHAADFNPWTRFGVGSWKKVRTYAESLKDGKVQNVTVKDTRTTLVEISDTSFTLKVEVTVDVGGKRFVSDPRYIKQGYYGELGAQTVEVKKVGAGDILIDGRKFPSEIRQVVVNGDELRRVSLMHFHDALPPFILKRETKATERDGTTVSYESLVEVVALDMPVRVQNETKSAVVIKTTHRQASGATTVVVEQFCAEIPGGIITQSLRETDATGAVTTRESVELSEFEALPLTADATLTTSSGQRRRFFQRSARTTRNAN